MNEPKIENPLMSQVTLRDMFAAQAMQGFLTQNYEDCARDDKKLARWAYDTADAMLKARAAK